AAGLADHAEGLAGRDPERDPVDRADRAVLGAKLGDEALDLEQPVGAHVGHGPATIPRAPRSRLQRGGGCCAGGCWAGGGGAGCGWPCGCPCGCAAAGACFCPQVATPGSWTWNFSASSCWLIVRCPHLTTRSAFWPGCWNRLAPASRTDLPSVALTSPKSLL